MSPSKTMAGVGSRDALDRQSGVTRKRWPAAVRRVALHAGDDRLAVPTAISVRRTVRGRSTAGVYCRPSGRIGSLSM